MGNKLVVRKNATLNDGKYDEPPNERFRTSRTPSIDFEDDFYDMSHENRGLAIIFNHQTFDSDELEERDGTEKDRERLEKTLDKLGFQVKTYEDYTKKQIEEILLIAARVDHGENDCIALFILSHGNKHQLAAKDASYNVEEMIQPIIQSRTLIGKPKLVFIQACRGEGFDQGVTVAVKDSIDCTDGPKKDREYKKIPSTTDLLIMHATCSGFPAWRNDHTGSYFIQALCKELDEHATEKDLLMILTGVNRRVAYTFESRNPKNLEMHGLKQQPIIKSTLTKTLYFTQKETQPENHSTGCWGNS